MAGAVRPPDIDDDASAASSSEADGDQEDACRSLRGPPQVRSARTPLIQIAIAPNRPPTPTNPARTTTTSESTGIRRAVRGCGRSSRRRSARSATTAQGQHQALDVPERGPPEESRRSMRRRIDRISARSAAATTGLRHIMPSSAGPMRLTADEHRPAGAHHHGESHAEGDRPALALDPGGQRQADARDQRAVDEDRRDQEAGPEEQLARGTVPS